VTGTTLAPAGQVWVCGACGKTSRTRFGFVDDGTTRGSDYLPDGSRVAAAGWDEACVMNAVLCAERGACDGGWKAVVA
jgi:hypothetical protein